MIFFARKVMWLCWGSITWI